MRGFFGAFILLFAAGLALAFSSYESEQRAADSDYFLQFAAIEQAGLERSEAESYVDAALVQSLRASSVPYADSSLIKLAADESISSSLRSLGIFEQGICAQTPLGVSFFPQLLFGGATKATVLKEQGVARVEYYVSGDLLGRFPCAKISRGNFSTWFMLPIGYTVGAEVVSA